MPGGRGCAGRWPLAVGRSGRDAGFGRLSAKRCRPARPARRGGKVGSVTKTDRRAVAAEAGDSLLESAGAAGRRRLPSGRGADGWTQDAELRSGLHALGGLGRAKGAGRGAALPKAGGCCRRSMSRTVATAPLAARPDAKAPGPGWGLERRPPVRSSRLRPVQTKNKVREPGGLFIHNLTCVQTARGFNTRPL